MLRILTTVFLVTVSAAAVARSHAQQPRVSTDVEELLWWLPPDTETVQVTQTPATPRGPLFEVIEHARGEFGTNAESYGEALKRHLRGARVRSTVEGSRQFAPPSGLGAMLYEGAIIVRFDKPLGAASSRLTADLRKRALKVERVEGLEVFEFQDKFEEDIWTSFITMPRANVLVIATNRAYLEELLRRRRTKTEPRALPETLPEWQRVDVRAPYWAVRHYRRDSPKDPTSPLRDSNMAGAVDNEALGVTAHVRADGRTVVAHYLSSSPTAEQVATRFWHHPGDGVSPTFRRVGTNAIEARYVARGEEDLSMFFFYLMAALGHATYV